MKAESVRPFEGGMFEQGVLTLIVVARPADVGVQDRRRFRGPRGGAPPIKAVVENGFDRPAGLGADLQRPLRRRLQARRAEGTGEPDGAEAGPYAARRSG